MGAERSPNPNATPRATWPFGACVDATVELDASGCFCPRHQRPTIRTNFLEVALSSSSFNNRQFSNYLMTASVATPYNEAVFALREEDTYPLLGAWL